MMNGPQRLGTLLETFLAVIGVEVSESRSLHPVSPDPDYRHHRSRQLLEELADEMIQGLEQIKRKACAMEWQLAHTQVGSQAR
jgi:hypothetical protein